MLLRPKVLMFVCEKDEKEKLEHTMASHAELTWTSNLKEMAEKLKSSTYDVVFCARRLGALSWRQVLEDLRRFDSNLPVIVVSQTADEAEWAEVLAAGAFDLLGPTYHKREVLPLMQHAAVSHEAQLRHDNRTPSESMLNWAGEHRHHIC